MDKNIAHKITSAESQFCVRRSEGLDCSNLLCKDDLPKLPKLPPFDCPTTTPTTTDFTTITDSSEENVNSLSTSSTTEQVSSFVTNMKENQGCCGPGVYVLMVIIIIVFLLLLIVICVLYRRKHKLHTKYNTSKVEEANGTKIQNSAEAVPLKSHNWVGSTPNSSKPNIPQSQSAEPLGPSESASMVKTPSDPHLMVDEESQVQDLQTQPSQVELITKDEDLP